ncbi:hypothetical protein HHK36_023626 [Tetracentron sinense]|uniref:Uncharacterized protein n=1 Tax=Tetracentron sinense TaxID=13715 RepID=A0A835D830_TETSI|nr:hypothetical protein HHK36_023626 [Tetracentron sinense]
MIKLLINLPFPSSMLFQVNDLHCSRVALTISCSSRSNSCIPKLEPFNRSKIDQCIKEPSLIQKSENKLRFFFIHLFFTSSDYCSTLEGDPSYSYWRVYFELKDLEVGVITNENLRLGFLVSFSSFSSLASFHYRR